MLRRPAFGGAARAVGRGASSIACLAFVVVLAIAFWAGAVWIGRFLMRVSANGF